MCWLDVKTSTHETKRLPSISFPSPEQRLCRWLARWQWNSTVARRVVGAGELQWRNLCGTTGTESSSASRRLNLPKCDLVPTWCSSRLPSVLPEILRRSSLGIRSEQIANNLILCYILESLCGPKNDISVLKKAWTEQLCLIVNNTLIVVFTYLLTY